MVAMVAAETRPGYDVALADALCRYIGHEWAREVAVDGLRRLAGGTAHETWAFDLRDRTSGESHQLVLRRDVEGGMLDGDLAVEFKLLKAVCRVGVAVPRPWWYAGAGSPLERPFVILSRVPGTDIRKHLAAHPMIDRRRLGHELVRLQCRVHELDERVAGLPDRLPRRGPEGALDHWSGLLERSGIEPGPLLSVALTWLRGHVPPSSPLCLVHGDFKTNNLLFGTDGGISVLDWELAHLGDPVEDLAWTMVWTTQFDLVGGLLPADDYLAAYRERSGKFLDENRLMFWRILALVKLAAIFLTGLSRGGHARPTLHLMGRGLHHIEAELADRLRTSLRNGRDR